MNTTESRTTETAHDPTDLTNAATDRQEREHSPSSAEWVSEGFRVRAEYFCERYLPIPDRSSPENKEDPTTSQGAITHLERAFGGSAAWLFYLGLALLTFWVMLSFVGTDVALAQPAGEEGDGGAIQGTIDNARNWLSTIMVSLGGLGMIASIAVKAVARTNENMHHAAHMGMTGSGIALIAGLLINDIISLLQGFVS